MFSHKSVVAELYTQKNRLTMEQLEKSMLRRTGKDGNFLQGMANIAYLVFMSWFNLIVAIVAICLIIFGAWNANTRLVSIASGTITTSTFGFLSVFYTRWRVDRKNEIGEIWTTFERHLNVLSQATSIPEEALYCLSEAELREIAAQKLQQIAGEVVENEGKRAEKESARAEFRRVHSSLFILGLAEGAWNKYFAH